MNYKFEILEKIIAYSGFFRLEKYRLRHELFAGGWSTEVKRECLERGHAVAVLPYDPERDRVVMLEQFRIGALELANPWLMEIVAGIIGPGESTLDVAHREAMEEAGCELLDIVPICEYLVSSGGSSETITAYCARVDTAQVGGIHGLAEEHEDIRVHVLPFDEVMALLRDGAIHSATPVIALQWLALNRQALLAKWGTAVATDAAGAIPGPVGFSPRSP
jgi:ADP-ribose pyrophosphatase